MAIQKRNNKRAKVAAAEKGRINGIDSLNLSDTAHAENDSVQGEENANEHDSE